MPTAFLHPFSPPAHDKFLTLVRGEGALVFDASGRDYVDALASLWYCQIGHGRQEMAEAIGRQAGTLAGFHTFAPYTNPPAEAVCAAIVARCPMPGARVFLTCSGSESVDSVIKLARLTQALRGFPERHVIISRTSGYHGVTYGGMSAQGIEANRTGFGALVPDVIQVPHHDLGALEAAFAAHDGRVAAVITEPVQAAGGVHPARPGYLAQVRALCSRHGAWLVHDEVVCGFGRLGTWFGSEAVGVTPDFITFAKGVTSGYVPLGGVICSRDVCDVLEAMGPAPLRHGFTYSGHPTACAAGVACLEIIEREALPARAPQIGACLHAGLHAIARRGRVTEVRGMAAVWGVELAKDTDANEVRDRMLDRGVIARPLPGNVIALCPPLVITSAQLDRVLGALDAALTEASCR